MADDPKDPHHSFEDSGFGIGQNTDGTFATFPAGELNARTAARDREEAASAYAVEQSEAGFPDEPGDDGEGSDLADLDDLDEVLASGDEA